MPEPPFPMIPAMVLGNLPVFLEVLNEEIQELQACINQARTVENQDSEAAREVKELAEECEERLEQHEEMREELLGLAERVKQPGFDITNDPVAENIHRCVRLTDFWRNHRDRPPPQKEPFCMETHREVWAATVDWDKPAARGSSPPIGPRNETFESPREEVSEEDFKKVAER